MTEHQGSIVIQLLLGIEATLQSISQLVQNVQEAALMYQGAIMAAGLVALGVYFHGRFHAWLD